MVWTVTRECDGMWLNLEHGPKSAVGVGGNWLCDGYAVTLYVRQMAYELVGRERDFEP